MGSEKQMASEAERILGYAPRNDRSVAETTNRLLGSKRSNSESNLMGSSREAFPQMIPESSHVMKMLRTASGGERLRASHYDMPHHGALQVGAVSASFMLQPNRKLAESEQQYNTCIGQSSLSHQIPSSRFRDGSSGPSVLSQLVADEGSRTGNKGSGILSSINVSNVISERNPSVNLPGRCSPATRNSELESSHPLSRHGVASIGRQMTIIYGGQVHVFDDVHPTKAEAIMALAGSSGVSWSTNLPKYSTVEPTNENCSLSGANGTSTAGDSLKQKYHKVLSVGGNSVYRLGSSNQGSLITKAAGTMGQAAQSSVDPKHEV